ncbi:flippase [Streptococcus sp. 121]|uniref:flippase n=1 Tax=Streptococcus sp. 121 TaxID=2797637 RepID=UPI0018F0E0CE|nr:flippase [Streptococcus sp. 121]MBJ6746086.1 flippase [Streptococcus sp. 121]
MKVIKNFIYNFLYKILTIILPLITVPYVTRIFSPDIMGGYNYTASITAYFTMFGMLGIITYGSNQIAKVSHRSKEEISHTFSSIYYFQLLTTSISLLTYLVYIFIFPGQFQTYFIMQILTVVASMIDISWLFQGVEDFKNIVIRNTIIKLLSVLCIFIFIKEPSDIYLYVFVLSISALISQLIMWLNVRKYVDLVKIPGHEILAHFRPTIAFFLPQISISIYNTLDRILLGSLGSIADVGLYTQAININAILINVVATLSAVLLPRMTNLHAQGKKEEVKRVMTLSMLFNSLITFPIVIGMLLVSQEFVRLFFGSSYSEAYIAINIIVFALVPIAFSEIVGRQTLIPTDNVKYFTVSVFTGAIISVLLNSVLIPNFGYRGAGVTMVIVETIVCALMTYFARNYLDLKQLSIIAIKPLVCSIVTGLSVYFIFQFITIKSDFMSIAMKVVVFGVIYGVLLVLTRTITKKEFGVLRGR